VEKGKAMESMEKNRLGLSRSAYLRSAASQPVNWYPWSEEAFERARALDRPILLDIGAVWCHWCHVMDRESYENPEIGRLINSLFVAIKVDRDERPDIDARYQRVHLLIGGQGGGWPLTMFLSPSGQAFFGGTYFPPEARYGRPGMKELLPRVAVYYREHKAELVRHEQALGDLQTQLYVATIKPADLSTTMLQTIFKNMQAEYDAESGGFGSPHGPKFLNAPALDFLLTYYDLTGEAAALDMVKKTLSAMAKGGVYDQLGGGFHRYAVDGQWEVPHFEKMSYDNAALLQVYVHAYQASGNEEFRTIARDIIAYTMRELTDKQHGGFYASQDADSAPDDDGDYYTWTREEIRAVLPPDQARMVEAYYDVQEKGEMRHNPAKNVLFVSTSLEKIAKEHNLSVEETEERLAEAREKLLAARHKRAAPRIDTSLIVAWNGMYTSAFLDASSVLGESALREFALKTLERLIREAYRKGEGMMHVVTNGTGHGNGLLDDQVFFAQACIDAYQATAEKRYLKLACDVMDVCLEKFWVPAQGGVNDRRLDATTTGPLHALHVSFEDSPTPSGNSMAAQVLERLALLTDDEQLHRKAEQIIQAYAGNIESGGAGSMLGSYASALAMLLHSPPKVAIIGPKDDARTKSLWQKALAIYRPGKLVVVYDPKTEKELPYPAAKDGSPLVYVCSGDVCYPPVRTVEQMVKVIKQAGR
jgi:uncharacterized protein YyaL (SSP411 family)